MHICNKNELLHSHEQWLQKLSSRQRLGDYTCIYWILAWHCFWAHGPLARYVKLRVVHVPGMPGTVSRHLIQRKPCLFILTPIYRSNLTSVVIWNIWQLSWFVSYKEYPFISFTNYLLKIVFILNYIFLFYYVVYIVHSPWLWSVTSTYFQIRANDFICFCTDLK